MTGSSVKSMESKTGSYAEGKESKTGRSVESVESKTTSDKKVLDEVGGVDVEVIL